METRPMPLEGSQPLHGLWQRVATEAELQLHLGRAPQEVQPASATLLALALALRSGEVQAAMGASKLPAAMASQEVEVAARDADSGLEPPLAPEADQVAVLALGP